MATTQDMVDAIYDLTRVTIALSGKCSSKAGAVRVLNELGIPSARIAAIMAMEAKDVRSQLTRDKKRNSKEARNV